MGYYRAMTTEIDFQQIVKDLRASSYSDAQIAHLCNCTRQYVHQIHKGDIKEVGFRIGQRLVKLHEAIQ